MRTSKEVMAEVVNLIPRGKANAIFREELVSITQMTDRKVRQAISDARMEGHIICSGDKGYYIPDDVEDLKKFYRKERKRAIRVLAGLSNTRKILKSMGVEVK